jgi:hypothetical protein
MSWRAAKSILKLRDQINEFAGNRDKSADGIIGDAAHASRTSDHNPWVHDKSGLGVVTAIDISHDPANGVDTHYMKVAMHSNSIAAQLVASRDARIKYIISNSYICSGNDGPSPWTWRPYHGANPHNHHIHVSVKSSPQYYDNEAAWDIHATSNNAPGVADPNAIVRAKIRNGSRGDDVVYLQAELHLPVDGYFGKETEAAVKQFQKKVGLVEDGIVGKYTWEKIYDQDAVVHRTV